VHGTGARHLEDLFREMWREAQCPGEIRAPQEQSTTAAGSMLLQIVPGTPKDDTNEIYATLLSVITYAQKSIDITMAYFVPDEAFEKALREAAKRGVVVRIILPSYSDFSGVFYAGRAHYDELLESGVQLFELESAFLHSKAIVVDGIWSSIGIDQLRLAQLRAQLRDQRLRDRRRFRPPDGRRLRRRPGRLTTHHARELEETRLQRAFQGAALAPAAILVMKMGTFLIC
jgi:hypothetical protein